MTLRLMASRVTVTKALKAENKDQGLPDTATICQGAIHTLARLCCENYGSDDYKNTVHDNYRFDMPDDRVPTALPVADAPVPISAESLREPDLGELPEPGGPARSHAPGAAPTAAPAAAPAAAAPASSPVAVEHAAAAEPSGDLDGADMMLDDSVLWARAMSLKLSWLWTKSHLCAQYCLALRHAGGESLWLCCSKHFHTGVFHRCCWAKADALTLVWPLEVVVGSRLFEQFHRDASALEDAGDLECQQWVLKWTTCRPIAPHCQATVVSTSTLFSPLLSLDNDC